MKFEMKKRILALALAGTTAFSVFGAAMSANAAWWELDSSHIGANDDAYYRHYTPAGTIRWGGEVIPANTINIKHTGYTLPTAQQVKDSTTYVRGTVLYVTPDVYDTLTATEKQYVDVLDNKVSGVVYYEDEEDFANENGYQLVTVDDASSTAPASFVYDNETFYVCKVTNSTGSNAEFYVVRGVYNTTTHAWEMPEGYTQYQGVDGGRTYYISTDFLDGSSNSSKIYLYEDVVGDIAEEDGAFYINGKDGGTNLDYHEDWGTGVTIVTANSYDVHTITTDAGYTDLDTTDPDNYEAVMANPVEASGEVYLYDYALPSRVSDDAFIEAWEDGTLDELMDDTGLTSLEPELGYTTRGIRGDVIYAWEDFLDEIGISDLSRDGLTRWARATLENYAFTYSDDFVYQVAWNVNGFDIYIVGSDNVDVYNFEELIEDIVNHAPSGDIDVTTAQTSEMVYMMQQYYKYLEGGYVDQIPVETDAWGDLLVALAEAPTEDDFRTSGAYDRYTNRVEDLVERYEEAETHAAVLLAEGDLYAFVTDAFNRNWQGIDAAGNEDTTALGEAIDNTFFNYNWQRAYSNTVGAEVYAGSTAADSDGDLDRLNMVDSDYANAWALYPAADYAGSNTGSYPGVETGVTAVNDSYYWFYNVYDLAYNVFVENEYQGTLDLMAETLNEAVAALTPTRNARASDILGAEEANEPLNDLIETDYTEAMWSDRTKINTYINDRVLNDEIGTTGTNNAEDIAAVVEVEMGYQRNQSVVTRTDITSVSTALSEAQSALTALRDDEDNYNAAQANALEAAIEDCEYIIDIYNGDFALRGDTQTVNDTYNGRVGDKDQILKSDITDAVQAVDDAINFKNIIHGLEPG